MRRPNSAKLRFRTDVAGCYARDAEYTHASYSRAGDATVAKSKARQVRVEEQVEPEEEREAPDAMNEVQEHGEEAPDAGDSDDVDTGNKASLVRAALAKGHTKPRDGVRWIKETYGVEIEGTYFSVAKSQQAKRAGESPSPRNYSTPDRPQASGQAVSPQGVPAGFGGDVRTIRGLLANHGNEADAVKDLVATVDVLVRKYGVSGLNEMIDAFS